VWCAFSIPSTYRPRPTLDCPISFNPTKCKTVELSSLDQSGLEILGSCLGSTEARKDFLEQKIEKEERLLAKLATLNHQNALLILRCVYQHNLRHLLRCLETHDLGPTWERLNRALQNQILRIRGVPYLDDDKSKIVSFVNWLPISMGGLGVAPFPVIAPAAYAAATAESAVRIRGLLELPTPPADPLLSQKDRCLGIYGKLRSMCIRSMDSLQKLQHVEASSTFGRLWLNILPTRPSFILSDMEVRQALIMRGLLTRSSPTRDRTCTLCGQRSGLLHHDSCSKQKGRRTTRHTQVLHEFSRALSSVKKTHVTIEPPIEGTADLRNDIRVVALEGCLLNDVDLDLTIRSMTKQFGQITPSGLSEVTGKTIESLCAAADIVVSEWRNEKQRKIHGLAHYVRAPLFVVLPISNGGYCDPDAQRLLKAWKEAMSPWSFLYMSQSISVKLIRSRAVGARLD
jgi:hypothetical protein